MNDEGSYGSSREEEQERRDRVLLRPWLEGMLENKYIPGLEWYDKEKTMFKVPWKHRSKKDWSMKHSSVFLEWARNTGRLREGGPTPNFAQLKTRLRCAFNKAPDIEEMKDLHYHKGEDPYKVYRFTARRERGQSNAQLRKNASKSSSVGGGASQKPHPLFSLSELEAVSGDLSFAEDDKFVREEIVHTNNDMSNANEYNKKGTGESFYHHVSQFTWGSDEQFEDYVSRKANIKFDSGISLKSDSEYETKSDIVGTSVIPLSVELLTSESGSDTSCEESNAEPSGQKKAVKFYRKTKKYDAATSQIPGLNQPISNTLQQISGMKTEETYCETGEFQAGKSQIPVGNSDPGTSKLFMLGVVASLMERVPEVQEKNSWEEAAQLLESTGTLSSSEIENSVPRTIATTIGMQSSLTVSSNIQNFAVKSPTTPVFNLTPSNATNVNDSVMSKSVEVYLSMSQNNFIQRLSSGLSKPLTSLPPPVIEKRNLISSPSTGVPMESTVGTSLTNNSAANFVMSPLEIRSTIHPHYAINGESTSSPTKINLKEMEGYCVTEQVSDFPLATNKDTAPFLRLHIPENSYSVPISIAESVNTEARAAEVMDLSRRVESADNSPMELVTKRLSASNSLDLSLKKYDIECDGSVAVSNKVSVDSPYVDSHSCLLNSNSSYSVTGSAFATALSNSPAVTAVCATVEQQQLKDLLLAQAKQLLEKEKQLKLLEQRLKDKEEELRLKELSLDARLASKGIRTEDVFSRVSLQPSRALFNLPGKLPASAPPIPQASHEGIAVLMEALSHQPRPHLPPRIVEPISIATPRFVSVPQPPLAAGRPIRTSNSSVRNILGLRKLSNQAVRQQSVAALLKTMRDVPGSLNNINQISPGWDKSAEVATPELDLSKLINGGNVPQLLNNSVEKLKELASPRQLNSSLDPVGIVSGIIPGNIDIAKLMGIKNVNADANVNVIRVPQSSQITQVLLDSVRNREPETLKSPVSTNAGLLQETKTRQELQDLIEKLIKNQNTSAMESDSNAMSPLKLLNNTPLLLSPNSALVRSMIESRSAQPPSETISSRLQLYGNGMSSVSTDPLNTKSGTSQNSNGQILGVCSNVLRGLSVSEFLASKTSTINSINSAIASITAERKGLVRSSSGGDLMQVKSSFPTKPLTPNLILRQSEIFNSAVPNRNSEIKSPNSAALTVKIRSVKLAVQESGKEERPGVELNPESMEYEPITPEPCTMNAEGSNLDSSELSGQDLQRKSKINNADDSEEMQVPSGVIDLQDSEGSAVDNSRHTVTGYNVIPSFVEDRSAVSSDSEEEGRTGEEGERVPAGHKIKKRRLVIDENSGAVSQNTDKIARLDLSDSIAKMDSDIPKKIISIKAIHSRGDVGSLLNKNNRSETLNSATEGSTSSARIVQLSHKQPVQSKDNNLCKITLRFPRSPATIQNADIGIVSSKELKQDSRPGSIHNDDDDTRNSIASGTSDSVKIFTNIHSDDANSNDGANVRLTSCSSNNEVKTETTQNENIRDWLRNKTQQICETESIASPSVISTCADVSIRLAKSATNSDDESLKRNDVSPDVCLSANGSGILGTEKPKAKTVVLLQTGLSKSTIGRLSPLNVNKKLDEQEKSYTRTLSLPSLQGYGESNIEASTVAER